MLNLSRRGSGDIERSLRTKGGGMRRLVVGIMLCCVVLSAKAADDSIYGTHWVKFEPIQVAGTLEGCSLVYLVAQADRAYLGGNTVAVNGSFMLRLDRTGKGIGVGFKAGLKDLSRSNALFTRPHFAYLQTATASTAQAKGKSFDGEDGYKVFAYSFTDPVIGTILNELITSGNATIGYNRKAGGMDVFAPLDLMVVDSEYTADQKVLRKRSPTTMLGFSDCVVKLLDSVSTKLGKN
jgi:hypothetical protein